MPLVIYPFARHRGVAEFLHHHREHFDSCCTVGASHPDDTIEILLDPDFEQLSTLILPNRFAHVAVKRKRTIQGDFRKTKTTKEEKDGHDKRSL